MKSESKKIFSGAAILGAGAFIAKLLGAIYRVPLTAIIGSDGLGLYQMVFPVYVVLLEFSGAGVPGALSKIVANEKADALRARNYLKTALKFFSVLGLVFTVLTAVFSEKIAELQGDGRAAYLYLAISPSVFFVCLISCFRGYFQGLMNMTPTAVSQIVEQTVKLICGLIFSHIFMPDITLAAAGAALAVTISEVAAFIWLFLCYKKSVKKYPLSFAAERKGANGKRLKKIVGSVIPVTLVGVVLPLSQVADSFIIINSVMKYSDRATALFGVFSGVAMTVINLPVSVCYGVAVTAIPSVSGAKSREESEKNSKKCLLFTLALSVPAAAACFIFAPLVVRLLFSGLNSGDAETAINLIKILSVNVVAASLLQTVNAVLIGRNKLYAPTVGMAAGVAVKTLLLVLLVREPRINVYGGAAALIACYFVANLLNFISAFTTEKRKESYGSKISRVGENDC